MHKLLPGTVLIAAPIGRDAVLTAEVLQGVAIPTHICAGLGELCEQVGPDVGAILLAEEALTGGGVESFLTALRAQEPWSDLPLLLLTRGDGTRERRSAAESRLNSSTFVTLLERPFRASTLISSVEAALRARQRQWQVRDLFLSRNQAIEDLQRVEEQLRQQSALLQAVTENAPDPIFAKDREGRMILANPATLSAVNKRAEEVLGRSELEWMVENLEAAQQVAEKDRRVMEVGEAVQIEEEIGKPGEERVFLSTKAPLRTADGAIIGIVGVSRDITERIRTERMVRESQELLQLVIETVAAHVVYCDHEERYRFVNRSYAARFGLMPEQMIGRQIADIVGAESYAQVRESIQKVLAGQSVETEVKLPSQSSGTRWMHLAYVPHQDEKEIVKGFVALITDAQERREAEETLREAKHQAEAANAAKDHFLATLSHELRTPLSPVLLCLSDRCNDPSLPPSLREDLAMIRRNVELEARLIDDMLDLTRISRGKIELHLDTVDVQQLLLEAINVCTAGDAPRYVIFEPQAQPIYVQADRTRLQQVFWNLINNAIKFSPEGGRVIVRTGEPAPGRMQVEVCDDGIGIETAQIPHLFAAFEQGGRTITKRYGGLGLGLAISQAIMHLHGGGSELSARERGRERFSPWKWTPARHLRLPRKSRKLGNKRRYGRCKFYWWKITRPRSPCLPGC